MADQAIGLGLYLSRLDLHDLNARNRSTDRQTVSAGTDGPARLRASTITASSTPSSVAAAGAITAPLPH
jgi:hypothetical protein